MKEIICINCPKGCHLKVDENNGYAVTGQGCERGVEYGKKELTAPTRTITSTVKIKGAAYPRCPIRTVAPIPKGKINDIMRELDKVELQAPVNIGDIAISDVLGTGVDIIVTRKM